MTNIQDLKEMYEKLEKEYSKDKKYDEKIKTLIMFRMIIDYLEEKQWIRW